MPNSVKCGVVVSSWTLALFALLNCSGTAHQPASTGPAITLSFVASTTPPSIEVKAVNALALSAAELVAHDGRVLRTATIEHETPPSYPALPPTVGVGVFGGSGGGGAGVGLGFPLGGYSPPPAQIRATARLPVEDVEAYHRDWPDLVVRLRFGTPPGNTSVADLPAPAPRER
jgi:hypothetical protein